MPITDESQPVGQFLECIFVTVINVEFKCQPVGRIGAIHVMDEILEEKGNTKKYNF